LRTMVELGAPFFFDNLKRWARELKAQLLTPRFCRCLLPARKRCVA
jgi:hypothetical protein